VNEAGTNADENLRGGVCHEVWQRKLENVLLLFMKK
jgi:hypothetical protein